ncbi:DMT family transporter [uncultured Pseudonocardia sp.]|uniref:DMT family transporter n=1 Tax=uncultured Pseudonocardia sp. TaxID=211455 RepID=UPI0026299B63|nr:DMT family transporter [uncultured Pseudonocardia sp.]
MTWWAVLLAGVSAVCYAVAAALQQHEAARTGGPEGLSLGLLWRLAQRPRWLLGTAAAGAGAGLHVVALSLGPLTVIQPIGAAALGMAVPLGALLGGRRATRGEWIGAGLVVVGVGALVVVGPRQTPLPLLTGSQLAVMAGLGALVLAGLTAAARRSRRPRVRAVLLAAGAGTAFGLTSALIRVLAAQLPGPMSGPVHPTAAAVVAFVAVGVLLCQNAYRDGGLGAPLATLTVLDPLVASLVGIAVFGEAFQGGSIGLLAGTLAAVTATAGVITLARGPDARGISGDSSAGATEAPAWSHLA